MTIISNSHRFIFVHLEKCGGSSVESAYQPHAAWNDIVLGSTPEGEALQHIYEKLHGLKKHSDAARIRSVVGGVWDAYWTVAIVRHPMRIYESYYKWIHKIVTNYARTQNVPMSAMLDHIAGLGTKRQFMRFGLTGPFLRSQDFNDFVLRYLKRVEPRTMRARLSGADGALLVDEWYRLEEMDRFWAALGARTGLDLVPEHSNRGSALDLPLWSAETERAVRQRHAEDFETFGYS